MHGMRVPDEGTYVFPGARPLEAGDGMERHVEPNVWGVGNIGLKAREHALSMPTQRPTSSA
jgi:hypothetical protein